MSAFLRGAWPALLSLLAAALLSAPAADAAFINWENCLNDYIIDSEPQQLQWQPEFFDAHFQTEAPYNLLVTLYGNVTGQAVQGDYPPPNDPSWQDDENGFGKITDVGSSGDYSTLLADFNVLTYTAYEARASRFCSSVVNGSCPLGPLFRANASRPQELHAFQVEHDFESPYRFSTLAATIRVISGDINAPNVVCVSANITPDLGDTIRGLVMWLPAAVLILKGLATLSAAIWSPWGSSDIFRWSSNYGRDEDLLRLVTPGFGDCLQYIQFVTLMGSLTLQFPGFFQPALAQTAWSLLLFNESYVSGGNGTPALIDGVYATNGTYGISTMRQLIGIESVDDVWACMAIWFLVIAVLVVVLCQLGFLGRWIYRTATKTSEEDLRQKNVPFTLGNLIRLVFNYFILPIVAISLFQLVISSDSPTSVVACAAIFFVLVVVAGGWILYVVFTTKPRTYLFDDMPTVLLYGPLYNTYSDSAAPFALVPVIITFMRAIAFGALQPSGIAQIIVLAICEVILILTLNGFRPFQSQTSMNAYHTFFAVVRLATILLCIAFVDRLGVTEAPKGWIGYVILLLHACVLVFGFFLNAAQTLIEVVVRSLGLAGHDAQNGAVRGSILNWRMLKKRKGRPDHDRDGSMTSNAAFLQDSGMDARSHRTRSMSASSQQLLNQAGGTPSNHRLSGFENFSSGQEGRRSPSGDLERAAGGHGKKPSLGVKTGDDTFYRAPRKRANTFDVLNPGAKSRSEDGSSNPYQDSPSSNGRRESSYDRGKDSPAPAYLRDKHDSNENLPRPDYAVREVDQYYRGAALSDQPTRKLKTGPADPQGPAAVAQSWFSKWFGGAANKKTKQPGKGFEVVRSSRAPPGMQAPKAGHGLGAEDVEMQTSPPMHQEPYRDDPQAVGGAQRSVSPLEEDEERDQDDFAFNGHDRNKYAGTGAAMHGMPTLHRPPSPEEEERKSPPIHPGMRAEQPSVRGASIEHSLRPRPSFQSHETIYTHETSGASRYGGRASSEYDPSRSNTMTMRGHGYHKSDVPSLLNTGQYDTPYHQNSQHGRSKTEGGVGGASMADDWLREVDQLSWANGGSQQPSTSPPAQTYYPPGSMANRQAGGTRNLSSYRQNNQPSVPRRSSRRTPSQEQNPFPFTNNTPQNPSRLQSQSPTNHDAGNDSDFIDFDSSGGERERNAMNPSHRRAADSIHRNSFGASAAMRGMSAEMMAGSPPQDGGQGGGGFGSMGGRFQGQ